MVVRLSLPWPAGFRHRACRGLLRARAGGTGDHREFGSSCRRRLGIHACAGGQRFRQIVGGARGGSARSHGAGRGRRGFDLEARDRPNRRVGARSVRWPCRGAAAANGFARARRDRIRAGGNRRATCRRAGPCPDPTAARAGTRCRRRRECRARRASTGAAGLVVDQLGGFFHIGRGPGCNSPGVRHALGEAGAERPGVDRRDLAQRLLSSAGRVAAAQRAGDGPRTVSARRAQPGGDRAEHSRSSRRGRPWLRARRADRCQPRRGHPRSSRARPGVAAASVLCPRRALPPRHRGGGRQRPHQPQLSRARRSRGRDRAPRRRAGRRAFGGIDGRAARAAAVARRGGRGQIDGDRPRRAACDARRCRAARAGRSPGGSAPRGGR